MIVLISIVMQYLIFRLTLPGRIVEDGREKAKFDIDKGRLHYYIITTHA